MSRGRLFIRDNVASRRSSTKVGEEREDVCLHNLDELRFIDIGLLTFRAVMAVVTVSLAPLAAGDGVATARI